MNNMNTLDDVVARSPEVMSGALVFAQSRVLVQTLFDYLQGGHSLSEFLADYPSVTAERAKAVIEASGKSFEKDRKAA